ASASEPRMPVGPTSIGGRRTGVGVSAARGARVVIEGSRHAGGEGRVGCSSVCTFGGIIDTTPIAESRRPCVRRILSSVRRLLLGLLGETN
ncbi:MAG: hypothetical protein ACREJM_04155, partial [Candidatus Saccharimonadales bacterium]